MIVHSESRHFDHIAEMCKFHFGNVDVYENCVLVLGYQRFNSVEPIKNHYGTEKKIIFFQLEQLQVNSPWSNPRIFELLRQADEVWDYDANNLAILKQNGINASLCSMRWTESLCKMNYFDETRDIDGLFYGYMNDRRMKTLTALATELNWLKFVFVNQVWGDELDHLISRSKVILNLHAYEDAPQEQVRIFYPVMNGRCVLSEPSPKNYFGDSIIECRDTLMPSVFLHLVQKETWKIQGKKAMDWKLQPLPLS